MTIKDLGGQVASVWEGLRPMTRKLLVGALQTGSTNAVSKPPKFIYDAHADWELSNLLSAIDEQSRNRDVQQDAGQLDEMNRLADTCVQLLEARSASAEVFIQLAERALRKHDYARLDRLSDRLMERFSAAEIAEIIRQTESAQIRAIAYETLATIPVAVLTPLLDDALYTDIVAAALEQKAFEYGSDEAKEALERFDAEYFRRTE
jgi:hypothetical protein